MMDWADEIAEKALPFDISDGVAAGVADTLRKAKADGYREAFDSVIEGLEISKAAFLEIVAEIEKGQE